MNQSVTFLINFSFEHLLVNCRGNFREKEGFCLAKLDGSSKELKKFYAKVLKLRESAKYKSFFFLENL